MRIHLNKFGNIDYEAEENKFRQKVPYYPSADKRLSEIKRKNSVDVLRRSANICFLCKNCGCEISGYWKYIFPSDRLDSFGDNDYITDSDYEHRYSRQFHDNLMGIICAYLSATEENIAEEIVTISKIDSCPICGAKLSKEEPFALQFGNMPGFYQNKKIYQDQHLYGTPFYGAIGYININGITSLQKINEKDHVWVREDVDSVFEYMNHELAAIDKNKARNKLDQYIHLSDIHSAKLNAQKPTLPIESLQKYIYNLINVETNIIMLTKRLESLYFKQIQNLRTVILQKNEPLLSMKNKIPEKEGQIARAKAELINIKNSPINPQKIKYPQKPSEPLLSQPHFFNKKKVMLKNELLTKEYERELKIYHDKLEQCKAKEQNNIQTAKRDKESKIQKAQSIFNNFSAELKTIKNTIREKQQNLDSIPVPAIGEKRLLDNEIDIIEQTLKKLFECRAELYGYNIIFEKYRDIVALSSFYEYLMSGRCESLEGSNGAYNIYENEIRMNRIIAQLDEVITSLDQIKENQYMIYQKMKEVGVSLSHLEKSMDQAVGSINAIKSNTDDMTKYLNHISQNTDVIAHNSAVTAYYSKVNSELTNALGFMVALK